MTRLPHRPRHAAGHSQQSYSKAHAAFDPIAYKRRNIIERTFCRLKDWRRIATRYDKLMINFEATVYIAALVIWWA
ncbi:transposase [Rhizobium leguminosarum]|uniref:transposase n=1 Tax=Rhizobium leguminosarum TaxID=384 RepID=UPI00396586A3|nr:transposase [Rhizobium leguminosarum]